MTSKRSNISKNTGLCLMAFSLFLSPCSKAVAAGQDLAASGNVKPLVSLHNERLSIKAQSVPLPHLLDSIAKTCDLRIFSASAEKIDAVVDVDVDVELIDRKIEDVLASLLKGSSYLVVYNEAKEKVGLFSSTGTLSDASHDQETVLYSSLDSPLTPTGDEMQEQADYFREQMEMLSQRIASGASDRSYEEAIKTKDPSFVQNDRELLASYEERLTRLGNGTK